MADPKEAMPHAARPESNSELDRGSREALAAAEEQAQAGREQPYHMVTLGEQLAAVDAKQTTLLGEILADLHNPRRPVTG
jgi:hypothetical protein